MNYILIVIAFITIAIFGPLVGETVTEKRMSREHRQMVEKLVYAQDIERDRLKKINEAHAEVIGMYEEMTNTKIYLSTPPPPIKNVRIEVGE